MTLCNADNSRKMKVELYKIRSTGEYVLVDSLD